MTEIYLPNSGHCRTKTKGMSMNTNTAPNKLLDTIIARHGIKNDAALSRMLEVAPPVLSKIRHHRLPVGAVLKIRVHEVFGMAIKEIQVLAAA